MHTYFEYCWLMVGDLGFGRVGDQRRSAPVGLSCARASACASLRSGLLRATKLCPLSQYVLCSSISGGHLGSAWNQNGRDGICMGAWTEMYKTSAGCSFKVATKGLMCELRRYATH